MTDEVTPPPVKPEIAAAITEALDQGDPAVVEHVFEEEALARVAIEHQRERESKHGALPQRAVAHLPAPPPIHEIKHEAENANLLSDVYSDYMAWTEELGWYWRVDSSHWRSEGAETAVRCVVRNALGSAATASRVNGTLQALGDNCRVGWREWDADPDVVGLPDGRVLDLRTGRSRESRASDYISRTLGCAHDPEAECPTWDKVWEQWLPDDDDRKLSIIFDGYSLTGRMDSEVFYLAHGSGRNGKGKHLLTLARLLGDYAIALPQHSLTGGTNQHPEWMVPLAQARLAYIADLPHKGGWRSPLLKTLTGGDMISAHKMRRNSITFKPIAKIWIGCNNKPSVSGDDQALYERMLMVRYTQTYRGGKANTSLGDTLKGELSGVLNRMLAGCRAYYKDGLPELSKDSNDSKRTYFSDHDQFGDFRKEKLVPGMGLFVKNADIVRLWVEWMQDRLGSEKVAVQTPLADIKEHLERHGGIIKSKKVSGHTHRGVVGFGVAP